MTRRLLFSYLAVTVVVLILLEVPFGLFYARREQERLTAAIDRDASVIASIYEDALESGAELDPLPAERYAKRTGGRVVIVNTAGASLVDTTTGRTRDFSTRPEIAKALEGERTTGTRNSSTLKSGLLYVAVPVASGGNVHGALRITHDTSDVDSQVNHFWLRLAQIALVVVGVICLIGWLVARSVTRPLRALNETARRYGEGDLQATPTTRSGPPEVRELANTMTAMAGDLAELIEQQRAFVADASHQLRTPLTALRLRLENLQSELSDDQAAELDTAVDEIDRLSKLVDDQLHLARADKLSEIESQNLSEIAADRVDIWGALADTAEVAIEFDSPSVPVECMAVHGAVEQILDNLLDNSISLSPAGATVTVAVSRDDTTATVVVTDEGPGMTDEEKAHATRRFWRGDPSRPGSGLGLSIVAQLVKSSKGTIQLKDNEPRGLVVTIELPCTAAAAVSGRVSPGSKFRRRQG